MPSKRRRRRERPPAEQPRRSFLQRRSTKWLAAAIVTLAIGITLGVIGTQVGGDGEGAPTAVPTATAVSPP